VAEYVKGCLHCQRNKSTNQPKGGLIQPIPFKFSRWESISMDFISPLPISSSGFDCIFVIIDRCTKMSHFIPCQQNMSAAQTAKLFFKEIVRIHGLPKEIISDRDTRFLSNFWTSLHQLLGTKLKFSTAYHPETDGQTERLNRTLEDSLRNYVANAHDTWDKFLYAVEFAYNSTKHSTTGESPFFLNYGFYPVGPQCLFKEEQVENPAVAEFLFQLTTALGLSQYRQDIAQKRMINNANKHRQDVYYREDDFVLLSTKNLKSKSWLSKKFTPKFIGPFRIIHRINATTYELELPARMKIHPRFHVSLLRYYNLRGESVPTHARLPEITDEHEIKLVPESISKSRFHPNGQRQFLIRWYGFPVEESTWVFESDLDGYKPMVREFLSQRRTLKLSAG